MGDPITVSFNPDADSSVNWQYAATPLVAPGAYSSIRIELAYDYNVNMVYFDGIQLFKEQFGNSYTYDGNGNVTSVKDVQGQITTYEYTNNNLTKQTLPTGAELNYTYDNYHNVKTATTDTGVVYSFGYDTWGNNTSVSIGNGITATAAYSSDGNRLLSTTDVLGKVTAYDYDADTNVLKSVQYPEDTENTKTSYTYDSMYRMASAAATTDTGTALTAGYTYEDDLLTQIRTGSSTYNFSYGNFGLRTGITIGNRTLASYEYTNDGNNYLKKLAYGNGDRVQYEYDTYGRVTGQTWEDGDTVTYKYDNSGALATVTDSATGRTTTYYYDFTDRLMKYVESGSGYSHSVGYGYDNINNLTSLVETINGTTRTTSYTYDDDNRVSSVTTNGVTESYSYDSYGRIYQKTTTNGGVTILTETYTYVTNAAGQPTSQVWKLRSQSTGRDVTYTYAYDDNGNIISVGDGTNTTTYAYDSANQLIRENNQAAEKTWTWTYDDAGNILNRKEYAFTTGTLGTVLNTISYSYDDTDWGDLLTAYNGQAVTHDSVGNPLTDGTWTYTWEHGRQLATMTGENVGGEENSVAVIFSYNADGIRTGKTVTKHTYHTHNYAETVTAPTCTEGGYTTYTCACGDTYIGAETAALGHNYSSAVTSPSCVSGGYTTYTCAACGYSYIDGEVSPTGHSYSETITAPTCTASGYTTYTCSACGYSYTENETAATGHSYTETVTAPTCTEGGYTTYTCACGDSYKKQTSFALYHNYIYLRRQTLGNVTYLLYRCTRCNDLRMVKSEGIIPEPDLPVAGMSINEAEPLGRALQSQITSNYSYIYNGSSLSQMTATTVTTEGGESSTVTENLLFTYDASGTPQTVTYNDTVYYYATNLQGDVTAILDDSGNAVVYYTYDAWGDTLSVTGTLAATLGAANPLTYRGYVYDSETGLNYVSSRYYDPEIGRFINADDVDLLGANGDFASLNLFAYCGNNPVSRADSNGQFWHLVVGGVIGGIIGAISSAASGGDVVDILIGAAAGAAGGVLAASGAGVVVQALGSAAISMTSNAASQVNHIVQDETGATEFDVGDMLFDGAVGLACGTWGGNGASYGNSGGIMAAGKQLFKRGFFNPQARSYYAKVAHNMGGEYVFKPLLQSLGKSAVGSTIVTGKNILVN